MQSLIDYGRFNHALPAWHPFTGVQSGDHWSSSSLAIMWGDAWFVWPHYGAVSYADKTLPLRVWAVRDGVPPAPEGMVPIPAGSFQMGDHFDEGAARERPVHTVHISAFHMDQYPVTKALWDEVYEGAVAGLRPRPSRRRLVQRRQPLPGCPP